MTTMSEYHGNWRASAHEAVPYSEDFPEALLVLPEWIDGALGAGQASEIKITFDLTNPRPCILIVEDNGRGLVSEKRMKDWTSKDIGSADKENVYGHGSKKALAKFAPEYDMARWSLSWRTQDRRGVSSVLHTLVWPFKGLETRHEEDEDDVTTCTDHGLMWRIEFDSKVLGKHDNPTSLMSALQELIRVRYEPSLYQPYAIKVSVSDGTTKLESCSSEWKSLRTCLDAEVATGNVKKTHDLTIELEKTKVSCVFYEIVADGRKFTIQGLPTFGKKNMNASRVHIARNGRYIEAMDYCKFMGRESHNNDNGKIGFIVCSGDELPTPCTTKVKMEESCLLFRKIKSVVVARLNQPPPSATKALGAAKAPSASKTASKTASKATTIVAPVAAKTPHASVACAPVIETPRASVACVPVVETPVTCTPPVYPHQPSAPQVNPNLEPPIRKPSSLAIEIARWTRADRITLNQLAETYGRASIATILRLPIPDEAEPTNRID